MIKSFPMVEDGERYLLSPVRNFYVSSLNTTIGMAFAILAYLFSCWGIITCGILLNRVLLEKSELILVVSISLWYLVHLLVHASVRQRIPSDLWVAALGISIWQRLASERVR